MGTRRVKSWLARVALGVAASFVLTACASSPQKPITLYDELGGKTGIEQIVHQLLLEIANDEFVRPHFKNINIAGFRTRLESFICKVADGPCEYNGRSMRESHATLGIQRSTFNRLVADLIRAMEASGIDFATQNALLARLATMEADIVSHKPFNRETVDGANRQ